jgi:hypothetical protein
MIAAQLDELKSRAGNSCREVAMRLGVRLRPHGREMMGPCPICSTDLTDASSTRWQTKGEGWVCAVCQDGGDVIALVQRALPTDFRGAVEWLGGVAGGVDPAAQEARERARAAETARREATSARYRENERGRLYDVWRRAAPPAGTPVEAYLAHRGLPVPPWRPGAERLRYVESMPYFHGQTVDDAGRKQYPVIHRGPAMVAPITRGGKFSGLHITYLDADGSKAQICDPQTGEALPAKKVRGSKSGAAIEIIRLGHPTEPQRIVIGEGIETVLSVWRAMTACGIDLAGVEFWSSVDLGNLGGKASAQVVHPTLTGPAGRARRVPGPDPDLSEPGIEIPASVSEVTVLGDSDSDWVTTQCAVHRGAERWRAARADRMVKAAYAVEGLDFNDMLRNGNG